MTKLDVKKFAKLARIKITTDEEKRFSKDLEKILAHFEELGELDTADVPPMTGGTFLKNVFREDEPREEKTAAGTESFPETQKGYVKVPKVFSADGGSAPGGE